MKEDGALRLNLAKAAHYCSTKKMHLKKIYKRNKKGKTLKTYTQTLKSLTFAPCLQSPDCLLSPVQEKKRYFHGHLKLN